MQILIMLLLAAYLAFTTHMSFKIYKKNYRYYYPLILEDGTDLHDQYPEFKKRGDMKLSLLRLIIMMPIALIRLIASFLVIIIFFLCLR